MRECVVMVLYDHDGEAWSRSEGTQKGHLTGNFDLFFFSFEDCCPMWAILFFLPSLICAAEDFKRPKYFFVFGEHRSGASYLSELIRSNTHPHDIQDCYLLNSHNEKGSSQHHMIHSSTRRPDTHNIPNFDDSKPPTFRR